MRYSILLLLFVTLYSCNIKSDKKVQTKSTEIDSTFHFTLTVGTNFIDSKTGTYTRKYTKDSKSVHFKFTNKEIEKIKSLYFDSKLDTLPNNYKPEYCNISVQPNFEEKLAFNFDGKQKKFIYNNDYECFDDNTRKIVSNMKCLSDYILKTVFDKKEVNQLELSDFDYL
jgi:hypothetical protein